ncbi:hypothetical protein Tco_0535977 [Tanacetum coccineum]
MRRMRVQMRMTRERKRERERFGLDEEGHGLGDEDHGLGDESQGLEGKGLGLEEEEAALESQQHARVVILLACTMFGMARVVVLLAFPMFGMQGLWSCPIIVLQLVGPLGACVVSKDTESDPKEAPSKADELQPLALSDSTTSLSPDHPLTHVSPIPTPTQVSFHRRTARMAMRTQPTLSSGMSARIAEAATLSTSFFRKRYRSSYEILSSSSTLPGWKRYRGTPELILDTDSEGDELEGDDTKEDEEDKSSDADDEKERESDESQGLEGEGLGLEEEEAAPEGQQQAVLVVDTVMSEPLGLGYGAARRRALESIEEITPSTYEVGKSSRSVPEQEGVERISTFRQPTLVTWVDLEDDRVYTDVPTYAPPAALVQTPPSPEWSLGSLPVSPSSHVVSSPIASLVATSTAIISVDEDHIIEVGAQLELHRSILHDHTQYLDVPPPTLVADIDRDVRELYTRSGVVKDEIFSQRYRFKNNEAKMVIYNALPRKEYERIFMCETAKDIWNSLLVTHQVHEEIIKKDSEMVKSKREQDRSITLKARKESSDENSLSFDSEDEGYAMADDKNGKSERKCFNAGDPNHLIGECPKASRIYNQRAFVGRCWSDSNEDEEKKTNDEKCLMAKASNESLPFRKRIL